MLLSRRENRTAGRAAASGLLLGTIAYACWRLPFSEVWSASLAVLCLVTLLAISWILDADGTAQSWRVRCAKMTGLIAMALFAGTAVAGLVLVRHSLLDWACTVLGGVMVMLGYLLPMPWMQRLRKTF